jgi:hypothetical protein
MVWYRCKLCGKGCILENTGKVSKGTYKVGGFVSASSRAGTADTRYYESIGVIWLYKSHLVEALS